MKDELKFGKGKELEITFLHTEGEKVLDANGRTLQEAKPPQTTLTMRDS